MLQKIMNKKYDEVYFHHKIWWSVFFNTLHRKIVYDKRVIWMNDWSLSAIAFIIHACCQFQNCRMQIQKLTKEEKVVCVYKILCDNCDKTYVRLIGRKLCHNLIVMELLTFKYLACVCIFGWLLFRGSLFVSPWNIVQLHNYLFQGSQCFVMLSQCVPVIHFCQGKFIIFSVYFIIHMSLIAVQ